MSDLLNKMRDRVLKMADPNSGYTQKDFDEEFGLINFNTNNPEAFKINFKFVNKSTNPDPQYATEGSSGFDLRANIKPIKYENTPCVSISSKSHMVIPTGLYFEIPENFEIQIRPRSGLAAKYGVTILNTPGTIDSDYRGEIKVILINHGNEAFLLKHGDRIAQAIIAPVTAKKVINLVKIDDISTDTERGSGGFGHTGIN